MKIYDNLSELKELKGSVVTIGNFDGLHIGHQSLIDKSNEIARKKNLTSVLLTFRNHPLNFIMNKDLKRLMTVERKYEVSKYFGIDKFVSIDFTQEICNLNPINFVKKIIIEAFNGKEVVVGHDFRFGKARKGDITLLRKYSKEFGFNLHVIDPVIMDEKRISSTLIRELLDCGHVKKASKFLGRDYEIVGKVVHGKKLGRKLGYPTLNLEVDKEILIPKSGVYYTNAKINDKIFKSATNIGFNPTIEGDKFSIETFVLDFDEEIYGEQIYLYFKDRLRDEKKFDSLEELKKQMDEDIRKVQKNLL
ncbi:bifunctional riboflavin kinase/FAD synthetase [Peptostreptococcaceae bacterium AGR-M142]